MCVGHPVYGWNPIGPLGFGGGAGWLSICRMAKKILRMSSSCFPTFCSSSPSLWPSALWDERNSLNLTKALMIAMFTSMARLLFRILEIMATPCSVKAWGRYLRPPQFEITICDLKRRTSCFLRRYIKSVERYLV